MRQKRTHHVNPPGTKSQWRLVNPEISRPTEDALIRDEKDPAPLDKSDVFWIRHTLKHGNIDAATRARLEALLAETEEK